MLVVYTSLFLNRIFLKSGYDEEQMLRKGIPFLEPEPHTTLYGHVASELLDCVPVTASLPPETTVKIVKSFFERFDVLDIPIVQDDGICIGFADRVDLQSALSAIAHRTSTTEASNGTTLHLW